MTKIKTAMIMAAGLGKRMRPLTADRPKPLVMVAGKPMIDHCLDKLAAAGTAKAIVNVHYMADMLEAHLKSVNHPLEIRISDERAELMETGGAMVQAEPLIDEDQFFCINSDNLWTDGPVSSLSRLETGWDDEKMDALLLLVPEKAAYNYNGNGDFDLDKDGRVSRKQADKPAEFIYTGIQIVSKRLLRGAPAGPFPTNMLWSRAIEEGRLFGLVHDADWFEVGSPGAIAPTERALANA